MKTNIRKWGNSAGTIIPAPVLEEAHFKLGDKVSIEAVEGKIVISPASEVLTLESLLKNSPKKCFRVSDEERDWIDMTPAGREI